MEFALVMPMLMALLIGITTAGLTYSRQISINNAARETARYGAVLPVDNDIDAWLGSVADVALGSAIGDIDTTKGHSICVAFVHPSGVVPDDSTRKLEEVNGVRTITAGSTCFPDTRPADERRVQVAIDRPSEIEAVIFSTNIVLDSDSVARYERHLG